MWVEHDRQLVNLVNVRDIYVGGSSIKLMYNNSQGVEFEYKSEKAAGEHYKLLREALAEVSCVVCLEAS